jgi:cytochrome c
MLFKTILIKDIIVYKLIMISFLFIVKSSFGIEQYTAHGGPVKGLAVSTNNQLMASASFDYSVVVWDLNPIKEKITLIGHDAAVNAVEFSPRNDFLVSGGDDNNILLWMLNDIYTINEEIEPIRLGNHRGKIADLEFSSDGKFLLSASWDGTVGVWNLKKRQKIHSLVGHKGPVYSVKYSKDNKYIYSSGSDGEIKLWKANNGEYVRPLIRNGWGISKFEVDEKQNFIAFGSTDGQIKINKFDQDETILTIKEDRVPILSMYYLEKENMISFGNAKGRMIILDTRNWSLVRDFNAVNGPIWDNILFPNDSSLIVAGLDDFLTRWQIFDFPPKFLERPGPARRFNPVKEVSNGEKQFARKCSVCHTLVENGKKRAGPTLYKIFGRKAGTLEGYKYSKALIESEIIWNEESINRLFDEGPDKVTPGTKMPIQRMKKIQDRQDLVMFLKKATN